jgi:hypothetical protein
MQCQMKGDFIFRHGVLHRRAADIPQQRHEGSVRPFGRVVIQTCGIASAQLLKHCLLGKGRTGSIAAHDTRSDRE